MIPFFHLCFPKIVLSTGFEDYEKGEVFRDAYQSLFGTGVFNSDGMFPNPTLSTDV